MKQDDKAIQVLDFAISIAANKDKQIFIKQLEYIKNKNKVKKLGQRIITFKN